MTFHVIYRFVFFFVYTSFIKDRSDSWANIDFFFDDFFSQKFHRNQWKNQQETLFTHRFFSSSNVRNNKKIIKWINEKKKRKDSCSWSLVGDFRKTSPINRVQLLLFSSFFFYLIGISVFITLSKDYYSIHLIQLFCPLFDLVKSTRQTYFYN